MLQLGAVCVPRCHTHIWAYVKPHKWAEIGRLEVRLTDIIIFQAVLLCRHGELADRLVYDRR
jgi:hypothetical protein